MSGNVHLWQPRVDGDEEFGWPPGWTVELVDETGSTNDDLVARTIGGDVADRTVLVTRYQSAGRGRRDRVWFAPPDTNLMASILFTKVPDDPGELMRRCGLAIDAAARALGFVTSLKWPNDVMLDGCKVAGLLAQRSGSGPVVVGFGVNVGWAPRDAARLDSVETPVLLAQILKEFDALADDIDDVYRSRLGTLGQRVRAQCPGGDIVGRAVDVTERGELVVDDGERQHRIDVGDVVHLRPDVQPEGG